MHINNSVIFDRCIIPLLHSELGDNDLYIPLLRLGIYKTIVPSGCDLRHYCNFMDLGGSATSVHKNHYLPVLREVTVYYSLECLCFCELSEE